MDRAPTIKDVARLAKVHAATASRALNPLTRAKVSAQTAKRVVEAAKALGYSPNSAARSLRTRASLAVGVIVPDLCNPVFPPIVRGIEDSLRGSGYMALLGNTDGDANREKELVAAMRGRQIEGLILATSRREDGNAGDRSDTMPTVLVNRRTDRGDNPSVTADNEWGIHGLISLLAAAGHLRIAHLAGPQELSTGRERLAAFVAAMAAGGLAVEPEFIQVCDGFTEGAGYRAGWKLLDAAPGLTAIVAGNDLIALGCLTALAQHGLSCPGDVSVTGFNDIPFLDRQTPALTTVRIPHYSIGIEAAQLVMERIAHPMAPAKSIVLPVEIVERNSTGPARSRG